LPRLLEDNHTRAGVVSNITGITPGVVVPRARPRVAMQAWILENAPHKKGIDGFCDYNYRKTCGQYGKPASEVMRRTVQHVDVDCKRRGFANMPWGSPWKVSAAEKGTGRAGRLDPERLSRICVSACSNPIPNFENQAIPFAESLCRPQWVGSLPAQPARISL